jgi:hypothetical protein
MINNSKFKMNENHNTYSNTNESFVVKSSVNDNTPKDYDLESTSRRHMTKRRRPME